MKKLPLLALLLSLASWQSAQAQTAITIGAARAQAPAFNTSGATVTLRGIVTNGAELGAIRYMQDGTGGIAVYSATQLGSVVAGDSILVTGVLKDFRGLLEIDPITSLEVVAGNRPLPKPIEFSVTTATAAYAEQYEGQLVKLVDATTVTTVAGAPVSAFSANTSYRVSGNAATVMYVNRASDGPDGLVGKPSPTGVFDVVGIMSQFTTTAPTGGGAAAGYQLLPRLYADFRQGNTPNFLATPYPTNISTTGFTVNFVTQNAGSSKLEYAASPAGPFTAVNNTASTTSHSLAITGLQPATIYYVKASSTNAVGLSESRVVPMITASRSTGKMRTYFTNPVNAALALPGNTALYLPNGAMADTVARYIGLAKQTLDIAIYNWNSATIVTAVNAAKTRGVAVRVIYEGENANISLSSLDPAIPRIKRQTLQNIMHNKFVVIDANSTEPNQPWVWTGSTNWTPAQLSTDRNNSIAVQDQSLARTYTVEFNEMWGGGTQATALFGSRKTDNTPHYFSIAGKQVESWFSPTDNVNGRLIDAIQTADKDLHIATMLLTQTDIGNAIANQIRTKNIAGCSEMLMESIQANSAAQDIFDNIKTVLGTRLMLDNPTGIMHHKYAIIDATAPQSDPQVFVGSHNWSLSANTENDENTLIVHDERIANQYYQEFAQRIADQNNGVQVCNLVLATKNASIQRSSVQVYPNPTTGKFRLRVQTGAARTARVVLRDATGRVVLDQTQPLNGQDVSVDASALKAGLYMVQIVTPEATQISRVVVE
ncbi:phospholipase D-like domain-containing protein [Hymenobacter lapidiphilus]|uniref:phospholipase D n=1 Tax=Hymenobacter lapidiphilus TaxID=2608003 RepID=A0A7Y7U6E9_9BACT|nr:phospholipase D-like domain-containing protein [Hymenobacter lapidiphilus]NVO31694.1 T9SS type A sorting domain-containing protein [Hymenobacter lapidiphilus]